MKFLELPPLETVCALLNYDQETGQFTWRKTLSNRVPEGKIAGGKNTKGYVSIVIGGKQYKAHRLAWLYVYGEDPKDQEIDHIDLDKANNKIANLRLVTRKQNNENIGMPRNNTSGYRGVSYQKADRAWVAYIYHNKTRIHLGRFQSAELAAQSRMQAESRLFTHSSGITKGTPT